MYEGVGIVSLCITSVRNLEFINKLNDAAIKTDAAF